MTKSNKFSPEVQLVAALGRVAGPAQRPEDRRAEEAGQRDLQGDRTGAGRLRQGEVHLNGGDR